MVQGKIVNSETKISFRVVKGKGCWNSQLALTARLVGTLFSAPFTMVLTGICTRGQSLRHLELLTKGRHSAAKEMSHQPVKLTGAISSFRLSHILSLIFQRSGNS